MLAADAQLDVRPDLAPAFGRRCCTSSPTPSISSVMKGSALKIPLAVYSPMKRAASSRLMPKVVCVRSLVPNEKNSADSAISPARSAARGSSIMVPT